MITGGEPMLQLDDALIDALHARGFEIAVETNGTLPAPAGIDWICVSPKAGHRGRPALGRRAEAGLAAGRASIPPRLLGWDFRHFLIQPMDCADAEAARAAAIAFVMARPALAAQPADPQIAGPALSPSFQIGCENPSP